MNDIQDWLSEIADAKKREKDWRKEGEEIYDIYENKKSTPFNILYSNTETLLPALFSQLPRPVFERRFKDDDPMGRHVSIAAQRMMEYLLDTDIEKYESFSSAITDAVLDACLPGRGVVSVKYDADILNEDSEEPMVDWEMVYPCSRKWDRIIFGYAHKWEDMPWVAYEEYLDKDECKRLGFKYLNELTFTEGEEDEEKEENEHKGKRKTVIVYQIWDKSDKTIKYLCPQKKEDFLKTEDDPLNLPGFFNCPKPLQFFRKSNDLAPVPLYKLYENQAKELNEIQARLNRIIKAIRARGVYNGAMGEEIEKILKEDDNALIPTDKSSMLMEGGLDKNIWFMPLAELVAVAQQLYAAREACKQVIYEISGISDILRGSSKASETLGAQKIKEAWGSMRLKTAQKEVQRYTLDTIKMMLDVAIARFSVGQWKKMTMLPYPMMEEKQQAMQMLELQKQQYQQQIIQAQQAGQQPQPFQPDPRLAKMSQLPAWEEILEVLKDHYARSYRIDIETNSTLDVEATEDKEQVAEFMNAMAQFMNGIAPMIQSGTLPFDAAKEMMLEIVRRYRFGRTVEDQIKMMQQPKPPQDPQMQKMAQQLQQDQQKMQQDKQKFNEEIQKKQFELQQKENELQFQQKMAELEVKHKEDLAKARIQMQENSVEASMNVAMSNYQKKLQQFFDKQVARLEKANANVSV